MVIIQRIRIVIQPTINSCSTNKGDNTNHTNGNNNGSNN